MNAAFADVDIDGSSAYAKRSGHARYQKKSKTGTRGGERWTASLTGWATGEQLHYGSVSGDAARDFSLRSVAGELGLSDALVEAFLARGPPALSPATFGLLDRLRDYPAAPLLQAASELWVAADAAFVGQLERRRGNAAAARRSLEAALAAFARVCGPESEAAVMAEAELLQARLLGGALGDDLRDLAQELHRRAAASAAFGPGHALTARTGRQLAALLVERGEAGPAAELIERLLAAGDGSAVLHLLRGRVLLEGGRADEAAAALEECARLCAAEAAEAPPVDAAVAAGRRCLEMLRGHVAAALRKPRPEPPAGAGPEVDPVAAVLAYAAGLAGRGELREARAQLEDAVRVCEQSMGPAAASTRAARLALAAVLEQAGDYAGARPLLQACVDAAGAREVALRLAFAELGAGDPAAARRTLQGLVERQRRRQAAGGSVRGSVGRASPGAPPLVSGAVGQGGVPLALAEAALLLLALDEHGRPADLAAALADAAEICGEALGEGHAIALEAKRAAAAALSAAGKLAAARPLLEELLGWAVRRGRGALAAAGELLAALLRLGDLPVARALAEGTLWSAKRRAGAEGAPGLLRACVALAGELVRAREAAAARSLLDACFSLRALFRPEAAQEALPLLGRPEADAGGCGAARLALGRAAAAAGDLGAARAALAEATRLLSRAGAVDGGEPGVWLTLTDPERAPGVTASVRLACPGAGARGRAGTGSWRVERTSETHVHAAAGAEPAGAPGPLA